MTRDIIRIANAGGFWGDDLDALRRQIEGGQVDYVTADYLAEITMSILMKQKLKDPDLGYVYDFINQIEPLLPHIVGQGVRIITNAGGMNPVGLARHILESARKQDLHLKVAAIDGDDILHLVDTHYPGRLSLRNLETGEDFKDIRSELLSANAYLGCPPILKALESGAQIILTGRATDTAITLAPMIHEFGWRLDDWDRLAAGVVAGHILECGAQASGGNFTDWESIPGWTPMGYPLVEMSADGTFAVTKHPDTGGLISVHTISEQLLYEMGNPQEYISPDVVVDFTSIRLTDDGENRVRVTGIKGRPSTPFLKVSMSYADGYKASGSLVIGGGQLRRKAEAFGRIFWERLAVPLEKTCTEFIGSVCLTTDRHQHVDIPKALVRFSVWDHDPDKVTEFGKHLYTLILSGPAGVAVTGGRPKPQSVVAYWPTLVPKDMVAARVTILQTGRNTEEEEFVPSITGFEAKMSPAPEAGRTEFGPDDSPAPAENAADMHPVNLRDLCLARSGDKGDTANIGVIARNRIVYEVLKQYLTPEFVRGVFHNQCAGRVVRFEVENLLAFNFLLENSLDGGGSNSLRIDAQGKLMGQALLDWTLPVDHDAHHRIQLAMKGDIV